MNKNKDMEKIYNTMTDKLGTLKMELESRRQHFQIMASNKIESGCFEQNAITDLLYMKELRSQIHELEHWTSLLRAMKDCGKNAD